MGLRSSLGLVVPESSNGYWYSVGEKVGGAYCADAAGCDGSTARSTRGGEEGAGGSIWGSLSNWVTSDEVLLERAERGSWSRMGEGIKEKLPGMPSTGDSIPSWGRDDEPIGRRGRPRTGEVGSWLAWVPNTGDSSVPAVGAASSVRLASAWAAARFLTCMASLVSRMLLAQASLTCLRRSAKLIGGPSRAFLRASSVLEWAWREGVLVGDFGRSAVLWRELAVVAADTGCLGRELRKGGESLGGATEM